MDYHVIVEIVLFIISGVGFVLYDGIKGRVAGYEERLKEAERTIVNIRLEYTKDSEFKDFVGKVFDKLDEIMNTLHTKQDRREQ